MKKSEKHKKESQLAEKQNEFQIDIGTKLEENLESLQTMLGKPSDLIIREVNIGEQKRKGAICYISGLTDNNLVNNNILKNIQENSKQVSSNMLEQIYQDVIAITDIKKVRTLDKVSYAILSGSTVLYLDGSDTVLIMGTEGAEKRSIEEPQTESVVRGPRSGFVESIQTNITLIRRELKDPNLRIETHEVGRRSKQKLVVCYVAGIVNPEIVDEINRRLKTIDIDFSAGSGFVEQWIEDSFLSPFPQLLDTERPDRFVYSILQGKVGILVEGSPFALVAPVVFNDALESLEDYTQRWLIGTFLRLIRYLSVFIAAFLPAIYVALVSYHPGLIPSQLAFSIAGTRENMPFPAIVEALLMGVTFEILQEAGIRLPKLIGQTIGIVGGIVIGEAAVSAGIVSPVMVVVTALTAVASFTISNYSVAIGLRVLRLALIIIAGVFGIYGIILGYIMLNIHMVNLKSIGVPYSAPFSPKFPSDFKNLFIRPPVIALKERPSYIQPVDKQKINDGGQKDS
ncbi:spore germination protein [Lysinibacillus sp. LZ02]|uniref:spore germination protein n=1 Tax=Lysinibacillus sp. LZ02 TaxID=3420668 RepID=UPI003D35C4AE